jgi:hypothetical protein
MLLDFSVIGLQKISMHKFLIALGTKVIASASTVEKDLKKIKQCRRCKAVRKKSC